MNEPLSLTDDQVEKYHNLESSIVHTSVELAAKYQEIQALSAKLGSLRSTQRELAVRVLKENGIEPRTCSFVVIPDSDRNGMLDVKIVFPQ